MKPTAFDKRVKRRVTAQEHTFFAVCPPGLTASCMGEIQKMGIDREKITAVKGGIEVLGKPDMGMALNLHLGMPSRILMRIGSFKATDFKQFETKFAAIDWELFLPAAATPVFKITCRKSALYHTDALSQRAHKIMVRHRGRDDTIGVDLPRPLEQLIFIRGDHDRFQISIDTSGDLLFKRGIKTAVTDAPLRETLAFAMLGWTGFRHGDILIDPMCGSGTFSLEGAMAGCGIPPGFFRSFAFEALPGFSKKTFAWQKSRAKKLFITNAGPVVFASDIDDSAVKALSHNSSHPLLQSSILTEKKDFFDIDPKSLPRSKKGVVMLNPPYGRRLGKKKQALTLYREIGRKLKSDFKGFRTGIILPDRDSYHHLGLKLHLNPIFHGGLDVFAGTGPV